MAKKYQNILKGTSKWEMIRKYKFCPDCKIKLKRIDLGTYTFKQYKCPKCHKTYTVD